MANQGYDSQGKLFFSRSENNSTTVLYIVTSHGKTYTCLMLILKWTKTLSRHPSEHFMKTVYNIKSKSIKAVGFILTVGLILHIGGIPRMMYRSAFVNVISYMPLNRKKDCFKASTTVC